MEHRNHYIAQTVNTASPAHLVTMLYDKLLESVRRVRHEFAAGGVVNAEMCHNELVRCQRIVEELRFGLDDERGGEIATNLRRLYDYCHDLLLAANMAKSPEGLDDVETIIGELRDVWFEQVDKGQVLAPS